MNVSDTDSTPEFEITDPTLGAVSYVEHGYPSPLVRWHCHNEYELHYIVASTGKVFVGDYIGEFGPGNLILTGRRLPHNWISDTRASQRYAERDMLVHFDHTTIESVATQIREFRELMPLLEEASWGIEFQGMHRHADHFMHAIRETSGPTRLGYFCQFMHELSRCRDYRKLSTTRVESNTDSPVLAKVDTVINFVLDNYEGRITLSQAAELLGMNKSYFSRFFKRATGNTFGELVTRIRIAKACELLSVSDRQITNICYDVGFNNVANFNRRFLALKHVTPREYRLEATRRFTRGG